MSPFEYYVRLVPSFLLALLGALVAGLALVLRFLRIPGWWYVMPLATALFTVALLPLGKRPTP